MTHASKSLLAAIIVLLVLVTGLYLWMQQPGDGSTAEAPDHHGVAPAPRQAESPFLSNPREPSLSSDNPLAQTIEAAATYLASRPLTPDVYWLAKRTGHGLGGEFGGWSNTLELHDVRANLVAFGYPPEAIEAWIESSATPEPVLTFRPPPVDPEPRATPRVFDEASLRRVIEVTIPGLQCTVACAPETVAALRESVATPGTDYVLTHQMLSLVLAYQFDCIPREEFEAVRERLATAMLEELLGDTAFTDLTAERMAMLAYAGLTNWIPDTVIAMGIDTQQPDGSWPVKPVFGPDSVVSAPPEHTAGLALFALAKVWIEENESGR